jgi:hypothetical protein
LSEQETTLTDEEIRGEATESETPETGDMDGTDGDSDGMDTGGGGDSDSDDSDSDSDGSDM